HQAYHDLIRQDENPLTFYIAYRPNAHVYLSQFFTEGGGPTNFSKFDVSEYVDQALATTDPDEQAQLWKEANIALQENFAGYGLYLVNQVYARAEYVDYGHELTAVVNLYPGITEKTSMSNGS
ncbi:MAG TPA: hypothetical protein VGR22_04010, partial [Thermomicrobiales bacterium]|nr:hypothetical protein [Thermomicrobiales bacterium]